MTRREVQAPAEQSHERLTRHRGKETRNSVTKQPRFGSNAELGPTHELKSDGMTRT
jgi:hypothetical protein